MSNDPSDWVPAVDTNDVSDWAPVVDNPKTPQYSYVNNASDIVGGLFPGARVTDADRDPTSPLGRKNPNSNHIRYPGSTIDMAPIPGMTFDQVKDHFQKNGYIVAQGLDEATHPVFDTTGPNWHFTLAHDPAYKAPAQSSDWVPVNTPYNGAAVDAARQGAVVNAQQTSTEDQYTQHMVNGKPVGAPDLITHGDAGDKLPLTDYQMKYNQDLGEKFKAFGTNPNISVPDAVAALKKYGLATYNYSPSDAKLKEVVEYYRAGNTTAPTWVAPATSGMAPASDEIVVNGDKHQITGDNIPGVQAYQDIHDTVGSMAAGLGRTIGQMGDSVLQGVNKFVPSEAVDNIIYGDRLNRARTGGEGDKEGLYRPNGVGQAVGGFIGENAPYLPFFAGEPEIMGLKVPDMAKAFTAGAVGSPDDPLGGGMDFALMDAGFKGVHGAAKYRDPWGLNLDAKPETPPAGQTYNPDVYTKKGNLRADVVQAHADKTTANWENAPKVNVVQRTRDLPQDIRENLKQDKARKPEALVGDDGTVYIIADNIRGQDTARVPAIIGHEILGHSGLTQTFGDGLHDILMNIHDTTPAIQEAVADYFKRRPGLYGDRPNRTALGVEEVLAGMSEQGRINPSVWTRITSYVRDFFRNRFDMIIPWSDGDIRALLGRVHRDMIDGGKVKGTTADGNRYMYTGLGGHSVGDTFPAEVNTAYERAKNGEDFHQGSDVHKETGWFVGPDNTWRKEISDHESSSTYPAGVFREPSTPAGHTPKELDQVLDHPELFNLYPELRDVKVTFDNTGDGSYGSWKRDKRTINLNTEVLGNADKAHDTLLHEVQHAIQDAEGFSRGGNESTALMNLSTSHAKILGNKIIKLEEGKLPDIDDLIETYTWANNDPLFQEYRAAAEKMSDAYRSGGSTTETGNVLQEARRKILQEFLGTSKPSEYLKHEHYDYLKQLLADFGGVQHPLDKLQERKDSVETRIDKIEKAISSGDDYSLKRLIMNTEMPDGSTPSFEGYRHLFGEVEARDTSNRRHLTDEQRKENTPYTSESEDITNPDAYIFTHDIGEASSAVRKEKPQEDGYVHVDPFTTPDAMSGKDYHRITVRDDSGKITHQGAAYEDGPVHLTDTEGNPVNPGNDIMSKVDEVRAAKYERGKSGLRYSEPPSPDDFKGSRKDDRENIDHVLREIHDPLPETAHTYKGGDYALRIEAIKSKNGRYDRGFSLMSKGSTLAEGQLSYNWGTGKWDPTDITTFEDHPISFKENHRQWQEAKAQTRDLLDKTLPQRDAEQFYDDRRRLHEEYQKKHGNRYSEPEEGEGEEKPDRKGRTNINVDKISSQKDIQDYIKYESEASPPSTSQTHDDTDYLATAMGLTPAKLKKMNPLLLKPETLHAARKLLDKTTQDVINRIDNVNTPKDYLNLRKAIITQAAVQEWVMQAAGNAGRALNALGIKLGDGFGVEKILKGLDLERLSDQKYLDTVIQNMNAAKMNNSPEAMQKILRDAANKSLPEDWLTSYHYASMLSGFGSLKHNIIGHIAGNILNNFENAVAGAVGSVGKRLGLMGEDALTLGGTKYRAFGYFMALTDSAMYDKVVKSFKTGSVIDDGGNATWNNSPRLPKALTLPENLHSASYTFFGEIEKSANLYERAARQAKAEGLTGKDLATRINEIVSNPTPEMVKEVMRDANVTRFMGESSGLGKMLQAASRAPKPDAYLQRIGTFLVKNLVPFPGIADNKLMSVFRRTPLAFLDPYTKAEWESGMAGRQRVATRIAIGSMFIAYAATHMEDSYDEMKDLVAEIPILNLMKLTHDAVSDYDKSKNVNNFVDRVASIIGVLGSEVTNESYLKGIGDYFSSMSSHDPNASKRYWGREAQGWVPYSAALREVTKLRDGKKRDTDSDGSFSGVVADSVKSIIPGLSETLPLRHDHLGNEMKTGELKAEDVVSAEIDRLSEATDKKLIMPVDKGQLGKILNRPVTGEEVQQYQKDLGTNIQETLKEWVASPEWKTMDDTEKVKVVEKVTRYWRSTLKKEAKKDLPEWSK